MEYRTVVFIDTNVALQCLDLRQLPWFEIDTIGPVLVLVTPTMLRETDSKKNDGRLGDHARRFNGLLRPLLGAEDAVTVRSSPAPQVDVALARCSPIQWNSLPELDPSESDSRLIAEALHTEMPGATRRVFVSQDIRPLDLARRHGFQIHHVQENWLRPKEMSEAERKAAALKSELASLKSKQPDLLFEWGSTQPTVEIVRVKDISEADREAVLEQIRNANPMATQDRSGEYTGSFTSDYDHTLETRYKKWFKCLLPDFVRQFEAKLELQFNQFEISLLVKNVGKVQAESLLLELTASGGWMNSKLILVSPVGPSAPRPKPDRFFEASRYADFSRPPPMRGKHDVVVEEAPIRSQRVRITCDDFRHGSEYEYKFVCWIDSRSESPFELKVVATASNLHGEATSSLVLQKNIKFVELLDLVDPGTPKYLEHSLAQTRLLDTKGKDLSAFEFERYGDDEH